MLPAFDLIQVNIFVTVFPEMVNVSVIFPFNVDALPRSEDAATASSSLPVALAVAAVLILTVIPVGSVPTAQVQAVCVIPTYPVNGILIVLAADVFPAEVQAIVCASLPRMIESPPVPAAPGDPGEPLLPSYILVMEMVS
ncbi:Uncharacterised protein [Chlamydia trachomatis]|nr:Uncharacterised protein [Chlamydia trachomatis]